MFVVGQTVMGINRVFDGEKEAVVLKVEVVPNDVESVDFIFCLHYVDDSIRWANESDIRPFFFTRDLPSAQPTKLGH